MSYASRRLLLAAIACLIAAPLLAAEPAKLPPPPGPDAKPEEIVKTLYDSRASATAFDFLDDKQRPRYLSKATDELLTKVFAKSEAENEPGIDYDPLIDGQDGEVKGLVIATTAATPAKVTVEARFTSFDDKMTVIFDFVNEKNIWKIEDIRNKEGNSLKAVAKDFLQ